MIMLRDTDGPNVVATGTRAYNSHFNIFKSTGGKQSVDDFINGTIAANTNDKLIPFANCIFSKLNSMSRGFGDIMFEFKAAGA